MSLPSSNYLTMYLYLHQVGKEMEPSIIFIDDCDRMFSKKLTPEQQATQPGRLKNFLANALTYIGPEDRILLVGETRDRLISLVRGDNVSCLEIY